MTFVFALVTIIRKQIIAEAQQNAGLGLRFAGRGCSMGENVVNVRITALVDLMETLAAEGRFEHSDTCLFVSSGADGSIRVHDLLTLARVSAGGDNVCAFLLREGKVIGKGTVPYAAMMAALANEQGPQQEKETEDV